MNKINKPIYFYLLLFLSTTLVGAALLYLPYTGKKPLDFIDALFIASSAFTVTGLSTIDISSQFNMLGESIILLLIQIGGLGIVTVTLLTLIFLNKKITIKNRHLLMITWNIDEPGGVVKLIIHLLIYSLSTEFIGALLLCLSYIPKFGVGKGIFVSLFTSVSAFNNAGFALFKNNLMDFTKDPITMTVLPLLIIMGGIGNFVLIDLIHSKKLAKLSLHSKVVLATTLGLITIGALFFFILEQYNTLNDMTLIEKLGASFFQSVTTRTAGFNSIDIGHIHTSTALLMMGLMFIGGAPLSAAGGIKVTTFAVILVFLFSSLRNIERPSLFHRTISEKTIRNALTIFLLSFIYVLATTFILSLLNADTLFVKVLFEVISAFGTVGLSMDFTTEYGTITKVIIIIVMLSGKIGLLTLVPIFVNPKNRRYYYAKGQIHL